jgi:hypothetical protein
MFFVSRDTVDCIFVMIGVPQLLLDNGSVKRDPRLWVNTLNGGNREKSRG